MGFGPFVCPTFCFDIPRNHVQVSFRVKSATRHVMEATDRGMFMSTKTLRLVPWFIPSTTTSLLCLWETGAPQRLGPLEGSCDMSDS